LLIYVAAVTASASGIYGIMVSRGLIRLLVSMEVLFNSIILTAAYIGIVVGADPGFYSLLLATIVLTIAEIAILTAILILVYKRKHDISLEAVRRLKG